MDQYWGTDLMKRDEGSDLQKKRLHPFIGNVLSDEDGNPLVDNYDAVPEITPPPPRAQFAEDSIWSCCRYSRIPRQKLLLLDYWSQEASRRARGPGEEPDPYETALKQFKHDWQPFFHQEDYQPSWFYRVITRSRRLGYLMLSFTRKEKNIIDNEKFTKLALKGSGYIAGQTLVESSGAVRDGPSPSHNLSNGKRRSGNEERAAFQRIVGTPAISVRESSPIVAQDSSFESSRTTPKIGEAEPDRPATTTTPSADLSEHPMDSSIPRSSSTKAVKSSASNTFGNTLDNMVPWNSSTRPIAKDRARTEEIPMLQLNSHAQVVDDGQNEPKDQLSDLRTRPSTQRRRSSSYLTPASDQGERDKPITRPSLLLPDIAVHEAEQPADMEGLAWRGQRRVSQSFDQHKKAQDQLAAKSQPTTATPAAASVSASTQTIMTGEHPLSFESTPSLQTSRPARERNAAVMRSTSRKRSLVIEENLSFATKAAQQGVESKSPATKGTTRKESIPLKPPAGPGTQTKPHVVKGSSPLLQPASSVSADETATNSDNGRVSDYSAQNASSQVPRQRKSVSACHQIFVIIGWFPSDLSEPVETCVIVDDLGHFLPDLKWHITGLRGWRALLSFKSVQGFGLYRCRPQQLGHVSHHTNENDNLALAQFFEATSRSYRRANMPKQPDTDPQDPIFLKRRDSEAWADWVHINLNNKRSCPFRSQLSLKLVLRWSQGRIAIASLFPLLLSMAIGGWYSKTRNDVQTGFTVAAYIVTAGAFIIAILAVLTALKDGPSTPYPKVRVSDDAV